MAKRKAPKAKAAKPAQPAPITRAQGARIIALMVKLERQLDATFSLPPVTPKPRRKNT